MSPYSVFWLRCLLLCSFFCFFNDTAPTEIYTLSLHDALPIFLVGAVSIFLVVLGKKVEQGRWRLGQGIDRKSTRLNSSHTVNSYAVFCLKEKNPDLRDLITSKHNEKAYVTTHTNI